MDNSGCACTRRQERGATRCNTGGKWEVGSGSDCTASGCFGSRSSTKVPLPTTRYDLPLLAAHYYLRGVVVGVQVVSGVLVVVVTPHLPLPTVVPQLVACARSSVTGTARVEPDSADAG